MHYKFRTVQEIGWAVATVVTIALMQILLTLEPEKIVDWHVWAIATAGALIRAAAGAVIATLGEDRDPPDTSAGGS